MFEVIRDTREKESNGWFFSKDKSCVGTQTKKLDTGDYTIVGCEKLFVIERKGSVAEWAGNLTQERFEKEMLRLENYLWPFIILEFTLEDMMNWPNNCGLPKDKIAEVKTSPFFLLKRVVELQLNYKTKIIFAGNKGKEIACSLFKRVAENVKKS
jgi:ERCC4-type nuclease